MSSFFSPPRRVHVFGLLGATLLLCSQFLPLFPITSYTVIPNKVYAIPLWVLVINEATTYGYEWYIIIPLSFLLSFMLFPCLIGFLASLTGIFGKEKRVLRILYLVVITVSCVELLYFVYMYLFAYMGAIFGIGFWVLLSGFLVSLGASIAQNLKTDLSLLPSFSIPRRAHVFSLLGAACLLSGWFLPWIITNFTEPPRSEPTFFWSLFVGAFSSDFRSVWVLIMQIVFFFLLPTLSFLTGILNSLAELSGKGKRVFSTLYLIITVIGLCNFLVYSYYSYCFFYCGTGLFTLRGSRILGSGFWLILTGLIVFLGVSIAQCKLFKPREVLDSL